MPKRSCSNSSDSLKKSGSPPRRQSGSPRKGSPQRGRRAEGQDSNKVYISGLPSGYSKQKVQQMSQKYGKIIDIYVVDRQTHSYAFVQYQQQSQAKEAIQNISGIQMKNKTLKCQIAKPRAPRQAGFKRQDSRSRFVGDGVRDRKCYNCGKEGHIAKFCSNSQNQKGQEYKNRRQNGDRRDSSRNKRRGRGDSEDQQKSSSKKRRKRNSSNSSSKSKPKRKRQRSESRSVRKQKKRDNKRKDSSSSSRSQDKRKSRKHKRSRSAELRKGKKRQASSSSSSD